MVHEHQKMAYHQYKIIYHNPGSGHMGWGYQVGRWTLPNPVFTHSLPARFSSVQSNSSGARLVAKLRKEFGGHNKINS